MCISCIIQVVLYNVGFEIVKDFIFLEICYNLFHIILHALYTLIFLNSYYSILFPW